jgi:hypothetical protein
MRLHAKLLHITCGKEIRISKQEPNCIMTEDDLPRTPNHPTKPTGGKRGQYRQARPRPEMKRSAKNLVSRPHKPTKRNGETYPLQKHERGFSPANFQQTKSKRGKKNETKNRRSQ